MNSEKQWFALTEKPRHEKAIASALRSKGYEEFLPIYRGRYKHAGRFKDVDLPLFPQYVFCKFDPWLRLPILTTPGVFSVVSAGRNLLPIEDSEIAAIQAVVKAGKNPQPWPFLKTGDRVLLEEGPLQGLEGILDTVKGECRLVVSVSLLQRSVAVEIDRRWVRPAPIQPGREDDKESAAGRQLSRVG